MHALPPLVTPAGTFEFSLSARTAEHLVTALTEQASGACADRSARHFAEALRHDAAFAIWAVCFARLEAGACLQTIDQLTAWLADQLMHRLASSASESTEDPQAPSKQTSAQSTKRLQQLVGQSYGVARLAEQLAEFKSLDASRAYLLGLLHAAGDWLAAVLTHDSGRRAPGKPPKKKAQSRRRPDRQVDTFADALPDWLRAALGEVDQSNGRQLHSVADCVAAAKRVAAAKSRSTSQPRGFRFDRRQHDAAVAAVQSGWSAASSHGAWLVQLAVALRTSSDLTHEFESRLETEKLDALKELAYGAGHEINNPLANISARAQTLLRDEQDPQRRRLLASINVQAFRAYEMIADMMLFARPSEPQKSAVDLIELVRGVVTELGPQAEAQQTELAYDPPTASLTASVDPTQIAVAVRALGANALEVLGRGGRVRFAVVRQNAKTPDPENSHTPDETVQIAVADDGPGISPEVRRHIFDPFFSGREAGRGLGFGLSKCWRIVRMHGGDVDVESTPGQGATFTITLPLHESQ